EEGPGAFPETLDEASFGQEFQMARDARLRLPQDVREIGYGQFGFGQKCQHTQARLLARRLERGIEGIAAQRTARAHVWASSHYIRICLYVVASPRNPWPRLYLARLTD